MFDRYALTDNSLKNVYDNSKIIGYSIMSRITYYRGVPCSMIHDVKMKVDDVEIPRELISFSPNGKDFFTLDELETVTSYKWEFGEQGTFQIKKIGGLAPGKHKVMLMTVIRVDYIPFPFEGTQTKEMDVQ